MRILEKQTLDRNFWIGINNIQESLGLDDLTLSKRAELNWEKFIFCKENMLSLPFHNTQRLADFFEVPVEKILQGEMNGHFTNKIIQAHWKASLPEVYQHGMGSKSLTLRHILKIAKKHGIYNKTIIHFQLPAYIVESKVDYDISVQLVADIIEFICQNAKISRADIISAAELNAFYFKDGAFGKVLKSCNNTTEIYENFVYLTSFLENNWFYNVEKIHNGKILLNSHPSERLTEIYKKKNYSSLMFTEFRIAVVGALTRYLGYTNAQVQITKSVHRGDQLCQFQIDTTGIRQHSSEQFFSLQ